MGDVSQRTQDALELVLLVGELAGALGALRQALTRVDECVDGLVEYAQQQALDAVKGEREDA